MQAAEKRKVIAIIVLVAIFVGASIFWQERGGEPPKALAETPATVEEALAKQKIMVDVSGAVAAPDTYFVTPDSRVSAAIEQAGGLLPEADAGKVNLARRCYDGMKINVPLKKVTAARSNRTRQSGADVPAVVNINAANAEEMEKLPGVGPSLAAKIVEYRQKNGVFKSVEQLLDVSGIGQAKFEQMREYVSL